MVIRFLSAIFIFGAPLALFAGTILTDANGATVSAVTPDGKTVQLKEGDEIAPGTQLNLNVNQSATIATDTGMNISSDQEAKIKIKEDEDGVPLFEVIVGEVRSYLSPSAQKQTPPVPRLRISTPGTVVGVRGTDFVVNTNSAGTDVHTLEGTVEVANSSQALRAGTGMPLAQGEGIEGARPGTPFVKKIFNRDEFMRGFARRHPRMAELHGRAEARRAQYRQGLMVRRQTFKQFQEKRQQARQQFIENRRARTQQQIQNGREKARERQRQRRQRKLSN